MSDTCKYFRMIINKTHLSQVLENSLLGHLVEYSDIYSPWFETEGPMEWSAYVLSSFQVVLNLFIVIILIIYAINKNVENNSFYFIINLATTDLIGFMMLLISLQIQASIWSHQSEYAAYDPDVFSSKMRTGCSIQMGILTFSYLNTIFATISLTVDRFLFISKPLRYGIFVTKESC